MTSQAPAEPEGITPAATAPHFRPITVHDTTDDESIKRLTPQFAMRSKKETYDGYRYLYACRLHSRSSHRDQRDPGPQRNHCAGWSAGRARCPVSRLA